MRYRLLFTGDHAPRKITMNFSCLLTE